MGRRDLERAGLGAVESKKTSSDREEKVRVLELRDLELEYAIADQFHNLYPQNYSLLDVS